MTVRTNTAGAPSLDLNLYARDVITDSRQVFARIRDAGPVVWLPRHGMYAIGRFADVRAALRDDTVFRSGYGVAANPMTNLMARGTTLMSDDDTHARRRKVLMRSLGAKALADVKGLVDAEAATMIERLGRGGDWFEAASAFSSHLPLTVVANLVGLRADAGRMLRWAAAAFDVQGPLNGRGLRAGRSGIEMLLYTRLLDTGRVRPGSWAASVFEAHDRGELSKAEARQLCIDFVAPALDTTILASTHLLWMLARHPDVWQEIRRDPDLVGRAVVENVRIASPIRGFTRRVAVDHEIGGVVLPAGARVVLLFGAANLDETEFPDPERFDPARQNATQLGWGNGTHTCVGIHLAKLEMQALLAAMVPVVGAVETDGLERLRNNTLQGIVSLQTRFAG